MRGIVAGVGISEPNGFAPRVVPDKILVNDRESIRRFGFEGFLREQAQFP
jgi:hypothetical protein